MWRRAQPTPAPGAETGPAEADPTGDPAVPPPVAPPASGIDPLSPVDAGVVDVPPVVKPPDDVGPYPAIAPEPPVAEREWVLRELAEEHVLATLEGGFYAGRPIASSGPDLEGLDQTRPTAVGHARGGHRSDVAADMGWINDSLAVGAVSLRGIGHHAKARLAVRQDAYSLGHTDDWVIIAVADGVSAAPWSHLAAQHAVIRASTLVRALLDDVGDLPTPGQWATVAEEVRASVEAFARRSVPAPAPGKDAPSVETLALALSTTLDIALVATAPDADGRYRYVHASMAGDGTSYLLDPVLGWSTIRDGQPDQKDAPADFGVVPLPRDPGRPPVINAGQLEPGQAFMLVTDGFSGMIAGGAGVAGVYLHDEWGHGPVDVVRLIQAASLMNPSGDDDRTAVIVWTC
ncbi:hypothetical protein nbrc107697_00150 [Gordonia crocea]|uniref:PPM-type phosphatase domain-containing protein n=1 Tax=Gordonia crocea TaxID=589162 RepID=A0A7M4BQ15_9ACTN|nr:hypothetical protein nbrc107697_00150 [Gordonia crocea]